MQIANLLYENVTALDAINPYEVLSGLPDVNFRFIATTLEPLQTDTGRLARSPTDHETPCHDPISYRYREPGSHAVPGATAPSKSGCIRPMSTPPG